MAEFDVGTAIAYVEAILNENVELKKDKERMQKLITANIELYKNRGKRIEKLESELNRVESRYAQIVKENEEYKAAIEQLKCEVDHYKKSNLDIFKLLNDAESEKCALHVENEQLKKQNELLKNEAIEKLIGTCSFEVKINVRDSE